MRQISINNDLLSLNVLDYGAIIRKLTINDREGKPVNLVVGLPEPKDYLNDKNCLGACVGRFAGRISSDFRLDNTLYKLHTVAPDVHLHGGEHGFSKKYWKIEEVFEGDHPFVTLAYESPHMEEGYPGKLKAKVTYSLHQGGLRISHRATSDRKTVINLVNHSYFLLDDSNTISHYRLRLNCGEYLETEKNLLPTGRILAVKGSMLDFTDMKPLENIQLDTPFLIDRKAMEAAELYSPLSGIRLRVKTNQPGMVVYTPPSFAGICFETQNLPDAPNMPHFPSSILEPGQVYENTSDFLFDFPH